MDFGPVPLEQALGAVLAHSEPLATGRLRKGTVLEAPHLAALATAGYARVTVARLGPQDMDEDSAALALARALAPEGCGLQLQAVGTGRVNLLADGPGLARIDAGKVHAVNACDPAITLATVPEWHRMDQGGMVATVKIVAYGLEKASVSKGCALGAAALSLARPVLDTASLIETTTGARTGAGGSDKGYRVTAERLNRLGVKIGPECLVFHDENSISDALRKAEGALLLILTASATSDERDTAPEALRRAGGTVTHFGMPVDPGNLLFLGTLGARPVVGLPGCARSPALNGADFVLERLICGVPVAGDDIRRMGVGGLLKEIPTRPRPRNRRD